MTIEQLDLIFPFLCFAYGAVMTFTLNSPVLSKIADDRLPGPMLEQFRAHRTLGMICLAVGSVWILQNLWLR